QGHASRSANSNPLRGWKRDSILAETRRPAPSLCSSGVDSRIILPTTKLFPFYQSRGAAFCPSTLSGSNSRPPPISLLSRPKALRQVERSRCNVARATFWRTTTASVHFHNKFDVLHTLISLNGKILRNG